MSTFKRGWYLLYTRPKHERRVAAQLEEQKVSFYLPTCRVVRNWGSQNKIISVPVFPSYIFIYVADLQTYFAGMGVEGVLHYVKFGKQAVRVEDKVVNDLRLVIENSSSFEVTFTNFQPGQTVTITEGALTGLTCEVVQYNKKERILVRVDLLQRSILMEMPVNHLVNI